jgi:PAS domain-containing protein
VQQLDAMYPQLRTEERARAATSTIETPVEQLDLATVITLSQAVAGEIFLDRLIDRLLRTALSQAGAERCLLILLHAGHARIEAEAATRGDSIVVRVSDQPATAELVPESVLHQVLHTREHLVIDDAAGHAPYGDDPYFRKHQVRSVLCLPLINQLKLTGVLYFENSLTAGAFAPRRYAVLSLVASQAAIALENARLYRDLQQREAKIQRLVDANVIGIFIWSTGVVIEANDIFLHMLGFGAPISWRAEFGGGIKRHRNGTAVRNAQRKSWREPAGVNHSKRSISARTAAEYPYWSVPPCSRNTKASAPGSPLCSI